MKSEIKTLHDLPRTPVTIDDMSWNNTGLWRFLTPTIKDKPAPCRGACPVGMPSPHFLAHLEKDQPDLALKCILAINPLPGITGRLCYHPCQTKCTRKKLDRPVFIQHLERYAADKGQVDNIARMTMRIEKVVVIGAGPTGLTAAYFLGRCGYPVAVFDPQTKPGGFLRAVSPKRLPLKILDHELKRLIRLARIDFNPRLDPNTKKVSSPGILKLLDTTAYYTEKSLEPLYDLCDRLEVSPNGRDVITVDPGKDFNGFKASQIALAIGLGQKLAWRALKRLNRSSIDQLKEKAQTISKKWCGPPLPMNSNQIIRQEDIRLNRFGPALKKGSTRKAALLNKRQVLQEAGRCLSCGKCNLCQDCVISCPDICLSIDSWKKRIKIDLGHCKGCGICSFECARHVITMERKS